MPRIALLLLVFHSFQAAAYFQMDFMKAKAANRASSQWTLADWLAQKNKMRLADHWLAMNRSASIFELNPSGGYNKFQIKTTDAAGVTTTVDRHAQSYQLDMYISLLNLMGEFEKTDNHIEAYGGALGLRLLGTSSQTTNLILRYGWRRLRHLTTQEDWENQFAEGQLQLYLVSVFGLQSKYRHYFPNTSNKGNKLEGRRLTAGAFVELAIFRLYADYYQEPLEKTSAGIVSQEEREGFEYGLKLFF